jgi:hypothetical protein
MYFIFQGKELIRLICGYLRSSWLDMINETIRLIKA